jgi:AraC-like DNA-binding protein
LKPKEFSKPNVPINYVLLTIEQAEARGVSRDELLKGVPIRPGALSDPDARVPLLHYGQIVARALRATGDAGLGYDFGLRTGVTTHGVFGLGLMSQPTLRHAVQFAQKYLVPLRSPGFTARFFIESGYGVIDVREAVQYGPLRQYAFDMLLVSLASGFRRLLNSADIEIWFECAQPDYYARYADRLPPVRFSMGANQLRFAAASLDQRMETANESTARQIEAQCEREMKLLGLGGDILGRVRLLLAEGGKYPGLEALSSQLFMSSRTLKRRLREHGFSFQQLLDEARRRDSIRLLEETNLSVEEIASRVGYTAHGNFIRAFRRWTGKTPAAYRSQPK